MLSSDGVLIYRLDTNYSTGTGTGLQSHIYIRYRYRYYQPPTLLPMRATGAGTALLACVAISSAYVTVRTYWRMEHQREDATELSELRGRQLLRGDGLVRHGDCCRGHSVLYQTSALRRCRRRHLLMHFVGSATLSVTVPRCNGPNLLPLRTLHMQPVKLGVSETVKDGT